jgi:hypothetical protein
MPVPPVRLRSPPVLVMLISPAAVAVMSLDVDVRATPIAPLKTTFPLLEVAEMSFVEVKVTPPSPCTVVVPVVLMSFASLCAVRTTSSARESIVTPVAPLILTDDLNAVKVTLLAPVSETS